VEKLALIINKHNTKQLAYCLAINWRWLFHQTNLHCYWQTSIMQCLRPIVLDTDVDGKCDKLVTETVNSLPHW